MGIFGSIIERGLGAVVLEELSMVCSTTADEELIMHEAKRFLKQLYTNLNIFT
jgi:hypothetical protein